MTTLRSEADFVWVVLSLVVAAEMRRGTWKEATVVAQVVMPSKLSPYSVLAFAAAVLVGAVASEWPWPMRAMLLEDSPTAWLSSVLLAGAALLGLLLGDLNPTSRRAWRVAALGLAVMALDERFMGHERLKEWILFSIFNGEKHRMGVAGDLPVASYVLGGLAVLWRLSAQRALKGGRGWLVAAVFLGTAALALDIADLGAWIQVLEESLEVSSEAVFLGALLRIHGARAVQGAAGEPSRSR